MKNWQTAMVCMAMLPIIIGVSPTPAGSKKPQETVTYTQTSVESCLDGTCTLTLYSGYAPHMWEQFRTMESLDDYFDILYLERDPNYEIEIEGFNYTCAKKIKIKSEVDGVIPFKIDGIVSSSHSFEDEEEIELEDVCFENIFAHNFTLGVNSTTIKLQDADTENIGDSHVHLSAPDTNEGTTVRLYVQAINAANKARAYIKFNVDGEIPAAQTIDHAELALYQAGQSGAARDCSAYHVLEQTWNELAITWNNQPCGGNFDNAGNCNLTISDTDSCSAAGAWRSWTVTNAVQRDYDDGDVNTSLVVRYDNEGAYVYQSYFHSKEGADSQLRPYLNITYSAAAAPFNDCDELDTQGETYTLEADISDSNSGSCMNITAEGVTLDCDGYIIDGDHTVGHDGVGIYAENATIINCIITDWYTGIYPFEGRNNISNNTVKSNYVGIGILYSAFNNITSNRIVDSETAGIYMRYIRTNNTTVIYNNISNNTNYGMFIYDNPKDNIIYNNFFNNSLNVDFSGTRKPNEWNTTQKSGNRVYSSGSDIAGNYWSSPDSAGFSDLCTASDIDGFCDSALDINTFDPCADASCDTNADYLPLSDGDTCTYAGSGNWEINSTEYCTIDADTNIEGNILIFHGTGETYINADVTTGLMHVGANSIVGLADGKHIYVRGT